jgi:hypothetical protein
LKLTTFNVDTKSFERVAFSVKLAPRSFIDEAFNDKLKSFGFISSLWKKKSGQRF